MQPGAEASCKSAFRAAASAFAELVSEIGSPDWDQGALGVWTVRDVVGHTSRSLTTVETYLGTESASPALDGPVGYFLAAKALLADPESVAQRGRDAGAALGDEPAARVAEMAERVPALVEASAYDAPVGTPIGPMTLATYLPTRIFELTVHTLDLARALGVPRPRDSLLGSPPPASSPGSSRRNHPTPQHSCRPALAGRACQPASRSSDAGRSPATGLALVRVVPRATMGWHCSKYVSRGLGRTRL